MANPVKVDLTKNTWTLVATGTDGVIKIRKWQPDRYYITYKVTGDPAPSGDNNYAESVQVRDYEIILAAVAAIDVYMYCTELDGEVVVAL